MGALAVALVALAAPGGMDGGSSLDGGVSGPRLVVRGALALPAEVYATALGQPAEASPAELTRLVRDARRFLFDSGYELATVSGAVEGTDVVLTVNEGLLEKIVFRGRLTFPMIQLKLGLDLTRDVFNRPHLEAQLDELSARQRIEKPGWGLVPTRTVDHVGPQVDSLGALDPTGTLVVRPQQKYELHLFFQDPEWSTGPGVDVRVSYFDGLEGGLNYQGKGLLTGDDRWRVGLMGGVGLRREVGTGSLYVFPSRLYAEAQWFTPALARIVRGFVWLRGEGLARQRADLLVENFYTTNSELSANLQIRPGPALTLAVGFGVQHYFLFGERAAVGAPPLPERSEERWRGHVRLAVELVVETADARWDRRHGLELEGRLWSNLASLELVNFGEVHLRYQKVFSVGWHDVWLRARGTYLGGDVLYPFEPPLGEFARGVFGDIFVRAALGVTGEFRFSLTRDLFKAGLFIDAVGWGLVDRATGKQSPSVAVAFGPTFHALVVGMFQLDLAVSFGVLPTGRVDTGLHATLVKVF